MFKNFKKTWWIELLMFILAASLLLWLFGADYILTHESLFPWLLDEVLNTGISVKYMLFIALVASDIFVYFALITCLWVFLFKLFKKRYNQ